MIKSKSWQPSVVALSFIFLFIGAYVDNVRGPLLPVVTRELVLNYKQSSLLIVAGNLVAIPATFIILPLLNRFGLRALAIVVLLAAGCMPLISLQVNSLQSLIFLGAYLGICISFLGTLCNIMVVSAVPPDWQARGLSALHASYGLASFSAAFGVNSIFKMGLAWQHSFTAASVAAILSLVFAGKLPNATSSDEPPSALLLKGSQWAVAAIFCVYVMGEVGVTIWLVTYLTEAVGMSPEVATKILGALFLVMAFTRVMSFFFVRPVSEIRWAVSGLALAIVAFFLGIFVSPYCFALVGCLGPFFPTVMARASRRYPKDWRTVMVWVVVGLQVGLAMVHLAIGSLIDSIGVASGFYVPALFMTGTIVLILWWNRAEKLVKSSPN